MQFPGISAEVEGIFAGGIGILGEEGHRSGIFKRRIRGEAKVSFDGIEGDEHADPRVHGGPEKAVHHFAAENYRRLAECFPDCAGILVPGSLGENISTNGLTERNVHIGDVFRMGGTVLQVSQPRSPCWKINHRFNADGMSLVVAQERMTGWYYRVIGSGIIGPGDKLELIERETERFSIDEFWRVQSSSRPGIDDMLALIAVPGLANSWKVRLNDRVRWIRQRHPGL
ncbi:MOSC domain-containing protein [Cupriavidus sp. 2TAF22]|uniref:MOSC domain-containing protein n=1 Tax=unclassified Cupriavidus TaxID=2640874 RepID=UPI003F92C21A